MRVSRRLRLRLRPTLVLRLPSFPNQHNLDRARNRAGQLCERFNSLYLVAGDTIVDEAPTYRGEGKTFL